MILESGRMYRRIMLTLVAMMLASSVATAQIGELQRVSPESQGVTSKSVQTYFDDMVTLERTYIHGIIVMRHGKIIGEIYPKPFAPEYKHTLYSCSKTFVGAAVGLAIADNKLRLTDRAVLFFKDELPDTISANLADMTVRDLLVMASGVKPDWNMRSVCENWIPSFLSKCTDKPGTKFQYDSMCTYLLSAIVQEAVGKDVLTYLKERLFGPMHITEVEWELSPEGYNTGGWGLYIQAESMAKFGQLLLDKGKWEGKQLLPEAWVEEMMKKQIDAKQFGYGYQIWMCEHEGTTRADGALGQYIYVIPDKDMVVAITQCSPESSGRKHKMLWTMLDTGVKEEAMTEGKDYKALKKRELEYVLPFVEGKAIGKKGLEYFGKTITLEQNRYGWSAIEVNADHGKIVLSITTDTGKSFNVNCGKGKWLESITEVYPVYSIYPKKRFQGITGPFRISACYAVNNESNLVVRSHHTNWVTAIDWVFKPGADGITIEFTESFAQKPYCVKGHVK